MEAIYIPLLVFGLAGLALSATMIGIGGLIGPRRNSAVKEMPYESGMDPIHDARRKFDVRFHLVAIAFLIFDVELLFLYPWAVASNNEQGIERSVAEATAAGAQGFSGLLVFSEIMVFIALLALGLVYAWR
ncbi:MAG: NADH-quinone oxidoreductase subunit A, partial [bacterium]|nr:NADH-quinone oxidoreductase subunit A [bacterium]